MVYRSYDRQTIIMIYAPLGRMISRLRRDDIRFADDIFALQILRKLSLFRFALYYFYIIRSEATLNIFRRKIYHSSYRRYIISANADISLSNAVR